MNPSWTDSDTEIYQQLSQVAVPNRMDQIATLLTLLPFTSADDFRIVELSMGEGYLAYALLRAFYNANLLGLEFDNMMAETARARLERFSKRLQIEKFDMRLSDWHPYLNNAEVVISSLSIHHLDALGKQTLFKTVYDKMAPYGVFLIADLVQPKRAEVRELFRATWDESVHQASRKQVGNERLYEAFTNAKWNSYEHPDAVDMPSPLFEQLNWLNDAGFRQVDCFWMHAGHAIYGGYKGANRGVGLPYSVAKDSAELALGLAR